MARTVARFSTPSARARQAPHDGWPARSFRDLGRPGGGHPRRLRLPPRGGAAHGRRPRRLDRRTQLREDRRDQRLLPAHDRAVLVPALLERIEKLEEEKKATGADIREVYSEAKSSGFDTKIMRKIITLRRKDHAERKEEEAIMELYLEALGMQA